MFLKSVLVFYFSTFWILFFSKIGNFAKIKLSIGGGNPYRRAAKDKKGKKSKGKAKKAHLIGLKRG